MATIAENVLRVRENIHEAAIAAGREQLPQLIAVTKFVDTERIAEAVRTGICYVGENRVQEYLQKVDFFHANGVTADIIGRLQTNKVKYIVGQVNLIQSVDRMDLALEIDKQAQKCGVVQNILVEVNIGEEEQKGGIAVCRLRDFLSELAAMQCIRVKGLMCIPPVVDEKQTQMYFASMRRLFEDARDIEGIDMDELSMGMSGDYTLAVKEGATMVRVGSAIFGARH